MNLKIVKCMHCNLCMNRKNIVNGDGSSEADIMFIGESPGYYEDKLGKPFVGKSGTFLNKYFKAANLDRRNVYVTNIVKCRPPSNRQPSLAEISSCSYIISKEISTIKPKIIVTLGSTAIRVLTNNYNLLISRINGVPMGVGDYLVVPMYHPSAILRNEKLEKEFLRGFKVLTTQYSYMNPMHVTNYNILNE